MNARTATRMVRIKEWLAQIQACQASNLPVKKWCEQNGIKLKTYYNRLRLVREEILESTNNERSLKKPDLPQTSVVGRNPVPTFVPLNLPRTGAAITVTIGSHTAEIQNGADTETIESVLRTLNRL